MMLSSLDFAFFPRDTRFGVRSSSPPAPRFLQRIRYLFFYFPPSYFFRPCHTSPVSQL